MQFDKASLRSKVRCLVVVAGITFAGCRNTCFVGFATNGKAVGDVKAGDPPPSCSLTQARGAIRAIAVKSAVCEACTVDARVQHLFVTVRNIQLRRTVTEGGTGKDWVEIAPELANQPRQFDLIGNSSPEKWVENAYVPAETYAEIRLRFCFDSSSDSLECQAETACGRMLRNCAVKSDGRIEPLFWPGSTPELVIAIHTLEGDSLAVLPDSIADLRLSFALQRRFSVSSIQQSTLQNVLLGSAIAVRDGQSSQDSSADARTADSMVSACSPGSPCHE